MALTNPNQRQTFLNIRGIGKGFPFDSDQALFAVGTYLADNDVVSVLQSDGSISKYTKNASTNGTQLADYTVAASNVTPLDITNIEITSNLGLNQTTRYAVNANFNIANFYISEYQLKATYAGAVSTDPEYPILSGSSVGQATSFRWNNGGNISFNSFLYGSASTTANVFSQTWSNGLAYRNITLDGNNQFGGIIAQAVDSDDTIAVGYGVDGQFVSKTFTINNVNLINTRDDWATPDRGYFCINAPNTFRTITPNQNYLAEIILVGSGGTAGTGGYSWGGGGGGGGGTVTFQMELEGGVQYGIFQGAGPGGNTIFRDITNGRDIVNANAGGNGVANGAGGAGGQVFRNTNDYTYETWNPRTGAAGGQAQNVAFANGFNGGDGVQRTLITSATGGTTNYDVGAGGGGGTWGGNQPLGGSQGGATGQGGTGGSSFQVGGNATGIGNGGGGGGATGNAGNNAGGAGTWGYASLRLISVR